MKIVKPINMANEKSISNIISALELLEQYLNDFEDSTAFQAQIILDKDTLKLAVNELEALI